MPRYRLAVLGDPIEHSRSPEIHTAMLALSGLDGTYERIRADTAVLSSTIEEHRRGEWHGLNVTMPLKAEAADFADWLSPQAGLSHSVNTLHMVDGLVQGHSTDATAFVDLLTDNRFGGASSVLVMGAGGSSAAVLAAIGDRQQAYVAARRPDSAVRLTSEIVGEPISWGTAVAGALVVNTTPLGMRGESLPVGVLAAAAGLIDLPYASGHTPAIAEARERGLPHADGHEFLVRQAIGSFHLWTGISVDYGVLAEELRKL